MFRALSLVYDNLFFGALDQVAHAASSTSSSLSDSDFPFNDTTEDRMSDFCLKTKVSHFIKTVSRRLFQILYMYSARRRYDRKTVDGDR